MTTLIIYAIVATALWYLGSRALITRPLWSRYPSWLSRFMDCPACTGFWWGALLTIYNTRPNTFDARFALTNPIIVGLCMIVLVPIGAGIMQRALWEAGSAADEPPTENDGR